jgi:hypothetical protein
MRKELEHFYIGSSYGGNQDWFRTFMMRIGGCGAETACDSSLYFAIHRDIENIYPFDKNDLTKADYVKFAHIMEKYLWPRMSGINRVDIFIEGYAAYLKDRGIRNIEMEELSGSEPYEKAAAAMIRQIDNGYPVPLLILNHRDRDLRDFNWHWFLVNGYDKREDGLWVKTVTYSSYLWVNLQKLWETGYKERGGMVLYRVAE